MRGLLRRLHGVVVLEYDTIFNTKYFLINSKMLPYAVTIVYGVSIHIRTYTHKKFSTEEWWWQTHTHIHTPMSTLDLTCVQTHTHTHISGRFFIALPGALPLHTHRHTHTSSCVLEICLRTHTHTRARLLAIWLMLTHIHTHAHAWLLAQIHISPSC